MGLPEKGTATKVLPVVGEITAGGSTDVGDISWVVPTGLFGWPSFPLGVSLHTWPVTACGGMSIGDKASLASARILAGAGYDLMSQPKLLEAAKADFRKRRGETKFASALAADKKPGDSPGVHAQNHGRRHGNPAENRDVVVVWLRLRALCPQLRPISESYRARRGAIAICV